MIARVAIFLILATAFAAPPAVAEGPAPFPEFTFKRIGVPQPGASGRITVQISPSEQAPAEGAPAVAPSTASGFEWFWAAVSPDITASGPANVAKAMAELAQAENLARPRLQALQDIAAQHGLDILKATVGTPVSPALVLALISVESAGRTDAQSTAGAQGLMQLVPATAERFGVADSTDAAQNIQGGVSYLAWLLEAFDQDPILALAGYNAGENAVRDNGGVPPYPETRAYVPRVLAAWSVARGLCMTPPELIADGCVFAVKGISSNG